MITSRIKNLINKGVIKAFRILIDYSKLGLNHYKVNIYLKDHKNLNHIISYLYDKPYFQCLNIAIGWSDIEPEFVLKNIEELSKKMEEINTKFPNVIKKYTFEITEKLHKEHWLPEMEFKKETR